MRVESYNPATMVLITSDTTSVDFGTVARGRHNSQAVVVKPVAEGGETLSRLALFLENNADLGHCQFGKYKSSVATQGIVPGDDELSDYFTQSRGVSDFENYGVLSDHGLPMDPDTPEYVWLDVEVGTGEVNLGDSTVNFRFVFEYV
jgi:hypothetical protein